MNANIDTFKGFDSIVEMVARERVRQDSKFGEQNHTNEMWLTILMEEIGEVSQQILNLEFAKDSVAIEDIIKELDDEMIQSIAVLVAWYQSRKRNFVLNR